MESTNKIVQNALAANGAYDRHRNFRSMEKLFAAELSALALEISKTAGALESMAARTSAISTAKDEKECIADCLDKCLAALKQAYARIKAQSGNVML